MNQIQSVLIALGESVGTPRGLSVAILARYGEWTQLQQLQPVHPWRYSSPRSYMLDLIPTEILRKAVFPGMAKHRREKAKESFFESERQCKRTNLRLYNHLPGTLFIEPGSEPLHHFDDLVKKEVRSILGRPPTDLTPRFSGGASTSSRAFKSTVPDKIEGQAHYYPDSACLLPLWWETLWGRASLQKAPLPIRGNVFFTVPKDQIKDRGCAKEAVIPCGYQLAIGVLLKKRILKATGIDLRVSEGFHHSLAKSASTDQQYATVDLSNASDTVAKVLVQLLLPEEWYTLLASLRAPVTQVDSQPVFLEKFSSMGNGYTFELETLIYLAIARVATRLSGEDPNTARAYGDDIIVPTPAVGILFSALSYYGFTINRKKTFSEGPFRESCGGDFFEGVPVRAHYLDKIPTEPQEWISLANGLKRLVDEGWLRVKVWKTVLDCIPSHIRKCRGPAYLGDLVLHDRESSWNCRVQHYDGYSVRFFRTYSPVAVVTPWSHWPALVHYSSMFHTESTGVVNRGDIAGYKLKWVQDLMDACTQLPVDWKVGRVLWA